MSKDSLAGIRLKIERAKHHIQELHNVVVAFLNSDPYRVRAETDAKTGNLVHYVSRTDEVPPIVPVITGEVIHGLRSVLDHLAWQLVITGGGAPTRQTAFPIFKDAAEYKSQRLGKIKRMRQDAIDAIDALEPYKGGNGADLWELHELNNIDKHRLLLTVGSALHGIELGSYVFRRLRKMFRGKFPPDRVAGMKGIGRPKSRTCPIKTGEILWIEDADLEPDKNIKFFFEIALAEPPVIEPKSLMETLIHFSDRTDGVVSSLSALL